MQPLVPINFHISGRLLTLTQVQSPVQNTGIQTDLFYVVVILHHVRDYDVTD